MKLQTTEEAIKWMVDNPGMDLWNDTTQLWYAFFRSDWQFRASDDGYRYYRPVHNFPHGPYYTEKPRKERTIEESLEKLKGRIFNFSYGSSGLFVLWVSGQGRTAIAPTLQAALSALVDEIEGGE